MLKKITVIALSFLIFIGCLTVASYWFSTRKATNIIKEVYNSQAYTYPYMDYIDKLKEDTVFLFFYDENNDDCVYLKNVILPQISNKHDSIVFKNMYQINIEFIDDEVFIQTLKNAYQISTVPSIVRMDRNEEKKLIVSSTLSWNDSMIDGKQIETWLNSQGLFSKEQ